MRRPLVAELSAEERSLARRWVLASALFYGTIAIVTVGAMLATSRDDKIAVAASFDRKDPRPEPSAMRPTGSLPDIARSTACAASQPCGVPAADGAGSAR